jgi:hypothetical protein
VRFAYESKWSSIVNKGKILLNLTLFICIPIIITAVFYFFDVWFMPPLLTSAGWLISEGLLFLVLGILVLGKRGIDAYARWTAIVFAASRTAHGEDTAQESPSEIMRRTDGEPQGSKRHALILILTGVIMILVSLVSIYFQYFI